MYKKGSFGHKLKPMRYAPFYPVFKYNAHQTDMRNNPPVQQQQVPHTILPFTQKLAMKFRFNTCNNEIL
jgi:hypothetical protein